MKLWKSLVVGLACAAVGIAIYRGFGQPPGDSQAPIAGRSAQLLIGSFWDGIGLRPAPELRQLGLPPESSDPSRFRYDSDPGYSVETSFSTLLSEPEVRNFYAGRCKPMGLKNSAEDFAENQSKGEFGKYQEQAKDVLCVGYYNGRYTTIGIALSCASGVCKVTLRLVSG